MRHKFVCQTCGFTSYNWLGKCPNCGEFNTFQRVEEGGRKPTAGVVPENITEISMKGGEYFSTNIIPFDNLLGGGFIAGQVVLVGGEPGIGKSTLMLQLSREIALRGKTVYYVSSEESKKQIKIRATRVHVDSPNIYIFSENNLDAILNYIKKNPPFLVIFDSIQMLRASELAETSGSLAQVRYIAEKITNFSKENGIISIIVGHITKGGLIAGPKLLEHIVDTVLYFEGEKHSGLRILRSIKNRFGPTDEIAIFEMKEEGLSAITDFSGLFYEKIGAPGQAITIALEGTHPIAIEIQTLLVPSMFATPRRVINGYDYNKTMLICAILERYTDVNFSNYDLFLNVVGGLKITDPAADLAVAAALISLHYDKVLNAMTFWGELSLSGNIRKAYKNDIRLNTAASLGFKNIVEFDENMQNINDLIREIACIAHA